MSAIGKRTLALFLAFLLCAFGAQPALASEAENQDVSLPVEQSNLAMNVKSAILLEQTTGQVLYEQNADELMPPASITKIMTLLLVMEALDTGKLKMEDMISCSEHAATMGGSQIWLEPNEQMSVHDLLKAAAISSANDASVLLGEAVAGSEEGFVAMMNERAKELGMNNTTFRNACGLDEKEHLTTARDIAIMSSELLKHDKIKEYTTVWMDSLRGGKTQLVNTNKLVRFYDGTTGLKTGTTNGAGSCLSASAQRKGLSLVAVVLGAPTSDDRFAGARKLLDYGFANYAMATPPNIDAQLNPVKVLRGTQPEVAVQYESPKAIVVKQGDEQKLEQRISLVPDVVAPVEEGQILGKVLISLDSNPIAEYPLKAACGVERMTFPNGMKKLFGSLIKLK
ncbi:D-alanyl-D-alanine carboxypeptidase family protein [Hydrogenoanaerobacterium sp.]|uniref:D-alanyl-D-alanine carboxypeptidase family protein n=1 Tax=Hydrogenoanaerobacterium sp. TaxID=2953763 RepID=UPI00289C73BC|nr:D-alanyl-D-alanine carboxypeptidase family protein [Hydrogenoanaerobacterium sp.]